MDRHDDASGTDYEQLRRHVLRAKPEHPASRQQPRSPGLPVEPPPPASRLSVMEWLVSVGQVVVRKLRRSPGSPMIRVHPRE
jgi:hypothetical protein